MNKWTIYQINYHPHSLYGWQSMWNWMIFTFKGRVKRVEVFCHVFISIRPHSFSGIPILGSHWICPSSRVTCPSHWDLTNCQMSVIRISVVIILPTCIRGQIVLANERRGGSWSDQWEWRIGMARFTAAGLRITSNFVCQGPPAKASLNVVMRPKQSCHRQALTMLLPFHWTFDITFGFQTPRTSHWFPISDNEKSRNKFKRCFNSQYQLSNCFPIKVYGSCLKLRILI